jgi:hypothetical protein
MAGHALPETTTGQALLTERSPPAVSALDAAFPLDASSPLHIRFSPDAEPPLDAVFPLDAAIPLNVPLALDAAVPLTAPLALHAAIPLDTRSAGSAVTDSSGVRPRNCAAASERATGP